MEPPVDVTKLSAPAQKVLDPKAPVPLRTMAARGIAPGLKPNEALAVVCLLAEGEEDAISTAARATLEKIPAPLLNGALAAPALLSGVLDAIAPRYASDVAVMEKILTHPAITMETVAKIAALASEMVSELVATNEERLLANPVIIERLYMNKATRMSTADRVLELAVRNGVELKGIPAFREAAAAIVDELIPEPAAEPTPDDILFRETEQIAVQTEIDPEKEDTFEVDEETGEEVVQPKFQTLHAMIASLTISQKIRRAMLGTAAERMLLVRDSNRLVSQATVRSPAIQEAEIVRISASRNVSDDVLRTIALDREWTRSHQIKLNLVQNPRTPFAFSSKLLLHLREHELKALAKSKNVAGAIVTAAKQQLLRRGIK